MNRDLAVLICIQPACTILPAKLEGKSPQDVAIAFSAIKAVLRSVDQRPVSFEPTHVAPWLDEEYLAL